MTNSETNIFTNDQDRVALELLDLELQHLDKVISRFNLFEALGLVRLELYHSNFLAFLLNPKQTHNLGNIFVKKLLQKLLAFPNSYLLPITRTDLESWELSNLIIRREWEFIDLLIVDMSHHVAIVIENKIDSSEHSDQLARYFEVINQSYKNWKTIFLYLTPNGAKASHPSYFSLDYGAIVGILENILEDKTVTVKSDVRIALSHYIEMLRRHIVNESDIAQLCRAIYHKHQHAVDLLLQYRPNYQAIISEILKSLIIKDINLIQDKCESNYVRFGIQDWDVPDLLECPDWTPSKRTLLFQFNNFPPVLSLTLNFGGGPKEVRNKLSEIALAEKDLFKYQSIAKGRWYEIYHNIFLTPEDFEKATEEDLKEKISQCWHLFLENDLPKMKEAIQPRSWKLSSQINPSIK